MPLKYFRPNHFFILYCWTLGSYLSTCPIASTVSKAPWEKILVTSFKYLSDPSSREIEQAQNKLGFHIFTTERQRCLSHIWCLKHKDPSSINNWVLALKALIGTMNWFNPVFTKDSHETSDIWEKLTNGHTNYSFF